MTSLPDRAPRIEPVQNPDDEQSQILSKTLLSPDAEPLNLFKVLVNYPEMMKRVNAVGGMFMEHGSLPAQQREIVMLRVAWRSECDYEFAEHAPIGLRVGLSRDEIEDLGKPIDDMGWDGSDLDLVRFTDEVVEDLEVTDETWSRVSESHSQTQMIELSLLAGYYMMLAAFLRTTRVPLEEGAEGLPTQ